MNKRVVTYKQFLKETFRPYIIAFTEREDVTLVYRNDRGRNYLTITDYPYYFCITFRDAKDIQHELKSFEKEGLILKMVREGKFVRIYCKTVNQRVLDPKKEVMSELKVLGIKTYEADLNSAQRCLIDHKLPIETEPRLLYFDIETDDRGKGIEIGRDRIVSIAGVNQEGKVYYTSCKDEKKILNNFYRWIEKYDVVAGWHSEGFDVPYIQARSKKLKIWYDWRQMIQLDLMQKMMEINKRNIDLIKKVRSFALQEVSNVILGESKVQHDETIWELYTENPKKLKEYNIQDVMLLLKLDNKLKISRQKAIECSITGCFMNEYAISRILDMYILRNSPDGTRFPTKPAWSQDNYGNNDNKYKGGIVLEPIPGTHPDVYHFDFTSLYPSIIRTFNISPETWRDRRRTSKDVSSPNEQTFYKKEGIIPKIITGLLTARNDIRNGVMKDMEHDHPEYETLYFKQYAFKTMSNSFYGILGARFTRYYRRENAEAITLSGHYLIYLAKAYVEEAGGQVLYGDTDSVFVTMDHVIDPDAFRLEINQFIAYHLFKHFGVITSHIDLKVEAIYEKVLLTSVKKKYVKVEEGELKIVGFEERRRETLPIAAKYQRRLFKMMLLDNCSQTDIINWLKKIKKKVVAGKLKKKTVTLQIKLAKDVKDYDKKKFDKSGNEVIVESKLPHVKVAKWLRDNGKTEGGYNSWEKGCYVKYIVTGKVRGQGITACSVYNYLDDYDTTYYWNTKIFAILERILFSAYPGHDWEQYFEEEKGRRKRKI